MHLEYEITGKIDAQDLKKLIYAEGIDLAGIADAQKLMLAYPPRPATDLMPSAKSVIVMAVAHSLGAVYSPDIMLWTRNKMQTSRLLDETAEKVGRLPPARFREWPGYIRMIRHHLNRRDLLVESGQTYITDVDNCIECMRVCPVGDRWKNVRPKELPLQKSGGTL